MKHYDVAIYGLWYGHNYGSIITYFALSKVMDLMNLSYAMIRNPLETEKNIEELHRSHPLVFAKDRYDITSLYPVDELYKLNDYFDSFIIGSDQMWNYYLSRPYKQSYFLDFVSDDKLKIAYASSFGIDRYVGPDEEKEKTKENLKRFNSLSVRDDFSQRICKDDFDVEAEINLDPVFLCPAEKYEELIEETDFSVDGEYIFAYILNPNEIIGEEIKIIAERNNKKVIVVFDQSGDKEEQKRHLNAESDLVEFVISPDVREWLYLFKNADFVLTDSFHGTCFSVIFRKKFVTLKNNERGGSRFQFILSEFRLLEHLIEHPEDFSKKYNELSNNYRINYDLVWKNIDYLKGKSIEWLKKALDKSNLKKHDILELPFEYNTDVWEKHFILGNTVLFTKHEHSGGGNYAVLPLDEPVVKGKEYNLSIKFKLKTSSPVFSFHVMEKDTKNIQIIYTHRITANNNGEPVELSINFKADENFDSFMVGAMQLSGEERYFSIENFEIREY